jgi:hypothetical protein
MIDELLLDGGGTVVLIYLLIDLRRRVTRLEGLINGEG